MRGSCGKTAWKHLQVVRQLSLSTYSSFKQTVTTINGEQSLTVSWSPLGNNGRKTNKFVFILSVVCF